MSDTGNILGLALGTYVGFRIVDSLFDRRRRTVKRKRRTRPGELNLFDY